VSKREALPQGVNLLWLTNKRLKLLNENMGEVGVVFVDLERLDYPLPEVSVRLAIGRNDVVVAAALTSLASSRL
jgi:hypothetical protein